jgi:hypothetical protein
MRKYLIPMFLISTFTQAGSLTDSSFEGVNIGMSVTKAIHVLKDYESDKMNSEDNSCYYLSPLKDDDLPHFMIESNIVVRIEVLSNSVITEDGVTVGSSKKEIMSVYKNVKVSPHPYNFQTGEYLEVKLSNGNGIIFETENEIVTSFRLGSYPAISYIEGCL